MQNHRPRCGKQRQNFLLRQLRAGKWRKPAAGSRLSHVGTVPVILPEQKIHVYEVRPRSDKRGFDLISDALALVGCSTASRTLSDMQCLDSAKCKQTRTGQASDLATATNRR